MEPLPLNRDAHKVNGVAQEQSLPQPIHRRNSGGGLFSRFSFSRNGSSSDSQKHHHRHELSPRAIDERAGLRGPPTESTSATPIVAPILRQPPSIASALQQQKTRRRRGSLRKVALLGRGAQRERREAHRANLSIDVRQAESYTSEMTTSNNSNNKDNNSNNNNNTNYNHNNNNNNTHNHNPDFTMSKIIAEPHEETGGFGLGISDITPRPSMDGYARQPGGAPDLAAASFLGSSSTTAGGVKKPRVEIDEPTPTSPTISYTTTDDEDGLHIRRPASSRGGAEVASLSSGSDSFFVRGVEPKRSRRATISRARSPLIAATSLLSAEEDWDYSETEWWGWVILIVTWVVFVVGMGSVFGVWSWAWDVGTTPYAPPELEDDPTLPITGYYPCLMILSCVMAWVWVVSAWVGMKYFRHAKISGD